MYRKGYKNPEKNKTHYENMPIEIYWKFYHQKMKKNSDKNSDISENPQSMFLSRNK